MLMGSPKTTPAGPQVSGRTPTYRDAGVTGNAVFGFWCRASHITPSGARDKGNPPSLPHSGKPCQRPRLCDDTGRSEISYAAMISTSRSSPGSSSGSPVRLW